MTVRELIKGKHKFEAPFRVFCWYYYTENGVRSKDCIGEDIVTVTDRYLDLEIERISINRDQVLLIECAKVFDTDFDSVTKYLIDNFRNGKEDI